MPPHSVASRTVKFFPLFFKVYLGFSPAGVVAVYALLPAVIAASASAGLHMARRLGRVPAMLLLRSASILLLLSIGGVGAALQRGLLDGASNGTQWAVNVLAILLHLSRSALANCTSPLSTSVSTDFTPSEHRAFWSSLTVVVTACWSGSAALGGLLADWYGFPAVFALTAALHTAGTLLQSTMIPIVGPTDFGIQRQQRASC